MSTTDSQDDAVREACPNSGRRRPASRHRNAPAYGVRARDACRRRRLLAAELASLIGQQITPPLLDARQAAAILNVPASWVAAEARAGRIPHVRLGRYVRFNREALLAWCESRATGPRARHRPAP